MGRDGIAGLVCLAASLGLLAATRGLPDASLLVPVGPGFYPRIVLGITAALSALLVATDIWSRRRRTPVAVEPPIAANYVLVLLAFVIVGLYVALLPFVGYRLATFGFVAALQATLESPRGWKGWIAVTATAFFTTLVTYVVFERYLNVLLPRGRWTDF
jgi:putative tricarboxylic transport membrane protein